MKRKAVPQKKRVKKAVNKRFSWNGALTGGPPREKLTGPRIDDWPEHLKPAKPPPGVVPKGTRLAMDEMPASFSGWVAESFYNLVYIEGWTFLGYPYLAQLSLISEYRLLSATIAEEATRNWIEIQSTDDEADKKAGGSGNAKSDKIKELEEELDRLDARAIFKLASEQDGYFGRSHVYIDTGDTDDPNELKKPIGEGDEFSINKLGKGKIKALRSIEPVWCYPAHYDAADPLKDNWYRPDTWFVMGKEIHRTRLLTFVGRPVSDLFKPAFSFGGLSLSQMAKPYIENWLRTRQSVNDLVQAFSTMVLKTDMAALMMGEGLELDKRLEYFNNTRNNRGVMAISKNDEDFANVSVSLSTLDELQAQAQEHMATPAQTPLVKLFGIQPKGLNASSEGELKVWEAREHAYQEYFFGPHLTIVFKLAQINLWGKVDPDLTYAFKSLSELDDIQKGNLKKVEAETDGILIDHGVLAPIESRRRLADDPDAPYRSIDVEDVPEPEAPEPEHMRETETEKVDEPGGEAPKKGAMQ